MPDEMGFEQAKNYRTSESASERLAQVDDLRRAQRALSDAYSLVTDVLGDISYAGRKGANRAAKALLPLSIAFSYVLAACGGGPEQNAQTATPIHGDTGPTATLVSPEASATALSPTEVPPTATPRPTKAEMPAPITTTASVETDVVEVDGWGSWTKVHVSNPHGTTNIRGALIPGSGEVLLPPGDYDWNVEANYGYKFDGVAPAGHIVAEGNESTTFSESAPKWQTLTIEETPYVLLNLAEGEYVYIIDQRGMVVFETSFSSGVALVPGDPYTVHYAGRFDDKVFIAPSVGK